MKRDMQGVLLVPASEAARMLSRRGCGCSCSKEADAADRQEQQQQEGEARRHVGCCLGLWMDSVWVLYVVAVRV